LTEDRGVNRQNLGGRRPTTCAASLYRLRSDTHPTSSSASVSDLNRSPLFRSTATRIAAASGGVADRLLRFQVEVTSEK